MNRSALVRLLVSIAISLVFLYLALSSVDLAAVGRAIAAASPVWLLLALVIVLVDLCLRALRWQLLLHGVRGAGTRPSYRLTMGYLTIGFAANFVLPARLGDVARAMLAGTAFRTPRLAIFGTIMIERLGDGLTMLALAIGSSLLVARIAELNQLALFVVAAGAAGIVALALGWFVLNRTAVATTRVGMLVQSIIGRVAAGAGTLTTVRGALLVVGMTWLLAGTACLVAWAVSNALGMSLSPPQVVLFLSGIALSLAIPAAPGAIGTYEFVGKTIIVTLGFSAEQGLATILLMRLLTTVPPAIAGLISLVVLQIRPDAIVHAAEGDEPAEDQAAPAVEAAR